MDARHLGLRHREEAEGVVVPQVALRRERQARQVIDGAHILRRNAVRREPLPIEGHPLRDVRHLLAQSRALHIAQMPALHRLRFRIPEHRPSPFLRACYACVGTLSQENGAFFG